MDPLNHEDGLNKGTMTWSERVFLFLAMIGICALCLTVTITVVSRTLYKPLIPDDVLIVREIMVATILFPLAAVTAGRAHISVTIFSEWLGAKGKNILSIFAHFIGLVFSSVLLYAGYRLFMSAWQSGEYYDGDIYIPMWIGYATFLMALIAFFVRLIVMFFRDLLASPKSG